MAQKTEVKLTDDREKHEHGRDVPADVTVQFGLSGRSYEIDLNKANEEVLRDALAPFIAAARRASGGKQTGTRSPDRLKREESQQIRDWARSRGMEVSERGRIPGDVSAAYYAAHPAS